MSQIGGDHYEQHDIEPWDVMRSWFNHDEWTAYLRGNCIKYLARYKNKNGVEDLEKCQHYLSELISAEQGMEVQRWEDGEDD